MRFGGGPWPAAEALVARAAASAIAGGETPAAPALSRAEREALDVLLAGYAALPLTRFGRLMAEATLTGAIERRLRLADDLATSDVASRALPDPVLVASPFRTGTTLLQRLLAHHPALRGLSPWETSSTPPPLASARAGGAAYEAGRRARVAKGIEAMRAKSPAIFRLHPVAPDEPEECFPLLETSLVSPSFAFHGAPVGYEAFLASLPEDRWAGAYRVYADQLRCADAFRAREGVAPRRLLLKGASHLDGLGALLAELPGARVVQLHRDPLTCLTSLARLYAAHHALYFAEVDLRAVGRLAVSTTRTALARAAIARRGAAPGRFLDVAFDALVRDPVAVASRVLAFAGAPGDARTVAAMRAYVAAHPAPQPHAGDASAAAFGLDADEAAEVFAPYEGFSGSA